MSVHPSCEGPHNSDCSSDRAAFPLLLLAVRTDGLRTTVRPQPSVVQVDRFVPYPPFGAKRSSLLYLTHRSMKRRACSADAHAEELVECGEQLRTGEATLLDMNDGAGLVVEDRHR